MPPNVPPVISHITGKNTKLEKMTPISDSRL